jgi:GNAT superfamily N-acetyltransferase
LKRPPSKTWSNSGEKNGCKPKNERRRISGNIRATFRFAIGSLSNCALASAGNRDQARANSGIEALDQYSGEALQDLNAGGGSRFEKDLRVIQATAADYERLLPLELGYQREEVVPASFDISDAALAAAFKHELGQGLTFALCDGDRPIAKARVSACGLRHCMLGGVYTIPSERKKGRAAFLVSQIIKRSQAHGISNFCLYAKQENAAALALYKSLGFTPRGEYLLVYY